MGHVRHDLRSGCGWADRAPVRRGLHQDRSHRTICGAQEPGGAGAFALRDGALHRDLARDSGQADGALGGELVVLAAIVGAGLLVLDRRARRSRPATALKRSRGPLTWSRRTRDLGSAPHRRPPHGLRGACRAICPGPACHRSPAWRAPNEDRRVEPISSSTVDRPRCPATPPTALTSRATQARRNHKAQSYWSPEAGPTRWGAE